MTQRFSNSDTRVVIGHFLLDPTLALPPDSVWLMRHGETPAIPLA